MNTSAWVHALAVALMLSLGWCRGATGSDLLPAPRTVADAVQQAYQHNASFSISLREIDLAANKAAYQEIRRPTISVTATPVSVRHRTQDPLWQDPITWDHVQTATGTISSRYDLGNSGRLDSQLAVAIDPHNLETLSDTFLRTFSLSFSQPLFQQSSTMGSSATTPDQRFIAVTNSLVLEVMNNFYNVLRRRQHVRLVSLELAIAQTQLDRIQAKGKPEVEILKAEDEVEKVREDLRQAQELCLQAEHDFADLLHLPRPYQGVLEIQPVFGRVAEPLDFWVEAALATSSLVADRISRLEEASDNLNRELVAHGWDVSFSVSYDWRNPNTTQQNAGSEYRASISVRKQLYPTAPYKIEELELALLNAEQNLESTMSRVVRDTETAFRQVTNLDARIASLAERLADADQALGREQRRVTAGLSTELELRELELIMERLAIDLLHAQYDQAIASAELVALSGFALLELFDAKEGWWAQ